MQSFRFSPPRPPEPSPWSKLIPNRILVVDDDPRVRKTLERMLRTEGLEVFLAGDGEEALAIIAEEDPDLVLLDVIMPGMNGLQVCKSLKSDPARRLTPVVLITGLGDVEDRVAGIRAGADDLLTKPFEQVELLARVRSLLRVKQFTDELERVETVVMALAQAIEERDPYTLGHCDRLSSYAVSVGHRLGLDEDETRALELGGVLHDLGKVTVPDGILNKQGPLTKEEREIIQLHPVTGDEICRPLKSFKRVIPIIRSHHERLDGSGYPDGLVGGEIPITARILSVVDVFDALTTERPYKPAHPVDEALRVLGEEVERGWWDPAVFAELSRLVCDHPSPGPFSAPSPPKGHRQT